MRNSMTKNAATGFMAGLGFGAGLALLFAPRSGVRTRVLLARKTRKGADYVKRQAAGLWDSATELVEKGQKEAVDRKKSLKRAVEMGKRTYLQSVG
jgi:gas vesicle protein